MNYEEIVAASKAFADRQDVEVSSNIDTFIILVEAKINRVLKTRMQSTRAFTPTVTDREYYPLPVDFAGMRDIQLNSDSPLNKHTVAQYNQMTPAQMNEQRSLPFAGSHYYCITAKELQIYPCQESGKTIEMVYFQKVPNLNADADTNWLSDSHPDIYLAGMMAEIEAFAKNYDASKLWYARLEMAIAELDNSDTEERWSGGPLQMRLA